MIRHSSLSPFRLSAASAISNLKSSITSSLSATKNNNMIMTPQQFVASATKRRKLSVPASSSSVSKVPDSDLKAAASALAVLATSQTGAPATTTATTAAATGPGADMSSSTTTTCHDPDVRRVLMPKDLNEIPPTTAPAAVSVPLTGAVENGNQASENVVSAPFHIGKPPLKASSARPSSIAPAAGRPPVPPSHHFRTQVTNGYPSLPYYPSSMTHRDYPQSHYPSMPHAHGGSNPAGWMWPMSHSQSHPTWPMYPAMYQRHHYHQAATAAHVSSDTSYPGAAHHPYAVAQDQGSTVSEPPARAYTATLVDASTLHAIEGLPAKHAAKEEREWTSDDDRRLAQLVSDYKNRSRSGPVAGIKRSFDELKEASAEDEPLAGEILLEASANPGASVEDDVMTSGVATKVIRRKRTTWTDEEDKELARVVDALKAKMDKICWSTVMKMMPGRDSKQCRDRYLNHLDPHAIHNKSSWSEDEDRKLLKFIKKHGTRWRLMQTTVLPKRTELTIKNRWNSAMKRRYTRFLSKRWGVSEDSIRLLTTRGLLNPGVDIEQMLRVARCKMIDVAYNVGDVESSREDIVSEPPTTFVDPNAPDDVATILEKYERLTDVSTPIYLRVVMGKMAEVDSANATIGVMETLGVNSFAYLRSHLVEKFYSLASGTFRFSVNHLGILSLKQEVDLGPIGAVLKGLATGEGTLDEPFELLVVE